MRYLFLALGLLLASKASTYKKKLSKVEAELKAVQKEINRLGKKQESLVQEVDLLERQEDLINQSIELLEARARALEEDLKKVDADIALAESRGQDAREKLALASRLLYITPKPDLLKAFLDFGNIYKAYRRVKYLKRMATYEKSLINRLAKTTERLHRLRRLKRRALGELAATKARLDEREKLLSETKAKKQRALERVKKQKDRKERYLARLEKSRAELKAILARLQAKQGKVSTLRGVKLLTPCEGKVVAGFGVMRDDKYGTKVKNQGIDISAPKGSEVKAAAGGKVAYVGWLEGYGNVVILEHDGFYTVYSHITRVSVKEGARVVKGTVLGKTGAKALHFELRVGGEAVDPEVYLF